MQIDTILSVFIVMFGLCIGSFLNVVIYRLEQKQSLQGRSFCPHCKHQLAWYDLVPLFSFLFLGGKCRYCKGNISLQYPLVELATAIIFLAIWWQHFPISSLFLWYLAASLVVILVYDAKHYLIPDTVLFPAIAVALVYRLVFPMGGWTFFLGAASLCIFFFVIFFISKGTWIGFGDVKLAILMGLLLGFPGVWLALFLASMIGSIWGGLLMLQGKKGLKSQLPFAPFLILGTVVAFCWGSNILSWYGQYVSI